MLIVYQNFFQALQGAFERCVPMVSIGSTEDDMVVQVQFCWNGEKVWASFLFP